MNKPQWFRTLIQRWQKAYQHFLGNARSHFQTKQTPHADEKPQSSKPQETQDDWNEEEIHTRRAYRLAREHRLQQKKEPTTPQPVETVPSEPHSPQFYVHVVLSTIKSVFLYLISIGLILGALAFGTGMGYVAGILHTVQVPKISSLRTQINNFDTSSTLYFANNVKMETYKADLYRKPVSLANISPYLQKAIVATEDEDFYQNKGIAPKAIVRAVASTVTGVGAQTGGSTLTQQLVKLQVLSSETTFKRKISEIAIAMRVDKYFSKDEVLQAYLNVVSLGRNNRGQNIAGVEEAAEGLFGKHAKNLTLAESAYIAGMPQSPSVYTPYTQTGKVKKDLSYAMERKNTVLFRMYRDNAITYKQYQAARKVDLRSEFQQPQKPLTQKTTYGYVYNLMTQKANTILAKQLAKQAGVKMSKYNQDTALQNQYYNKANTEFSEKGYKINGTINKKVYNSMQKVMKEREDTFGETKTSSIPNVATGKSSTDTEPVQNGTVLLDNKTGALIGFVGGRNFSLTQYNHIFEKRSPGSTIKPILVYGPAVENKLIGTQSMIADFKVDFGGYSPTDYDGEIKNKFVSASQALEHSYNIPAVNLYKELLKKKNPKEYLEKMGIHFTDSEYQLLGLSLGGTTNGVTVTQEASAFSTFSNEGKHASPYVIQSITDPSGKVIYQQKNTTQRVFSKSTAYIMKKMLKGVVTDGTGSDVTNQLNFNTKNLIGKTGTSNDYKDIWFIGSTPGVTLASWMGYDNNYGNSYTLTSESSESNNAYWAALANAIYKADPSALKLKQTMAKPSGVTTTTVLKKTGLKKGDVTINGTTHSITGSTVKSLTNGYTPGKTTYHFAIGGNSKNYKEFWNYDLGKSNKYGIATVINSKGKEVTAILGSDGTPTN
ncbi:transglycosylase domain-containing protein [Lactobacillus selangorensis]|uniref:transglycosylase domain-containing protein n=1 Tax=Lactobacillus selangorensis TaxID=81857 RepID=UPI00070D3378|nr:transglycosylase domain-containing protein [Lactobacillus selangorensis]